MERGVALLVSEAPPCILFEDDHLLAVNKPAGLATHAPAPFSGEGLYDWLRNREPRWSSLAILQRLDKDTSGVLVFSKTAAGNRSLADQFARRTVRKKYLLLTDRPVPSRDFTVRSKLIRLGERYASRSATSGVEAVTRFRVLESGPAGHNVVQAEPITGRTHQIRVHASERGFPILGDVLYGGTPFQRVCLHSAELRLQHPLTAAPRTFVAPCDFSIDARTLLREALWEPDTTNCYRLVHGSADGRPGWYVDRLGDYLLSMSGTLDPGLADHAELLAWWRNRYSIRGVYHKQLDRDPGRAGVSHPSPQLVLGEPGPNPLIVVENGVRFTLSFDEGYSIGLFLDQRDNRRRLLTNHIAADFPLFAQGAAAAQILNAFAYTCAFSVCGALAGARVTSLDLSRKYLQWGERNFQLNQLDPQDHDFIYGDAFQWMQRLKKKQRAFDLIILDPPTFSRSKEHGHFQVEKDYKRLVAVALPLLKPAGVLLTSTNSARLKPEAFLEMVNVAIHSAKRPILHQHYAPQPPDFPVTRDEPAHLKTLWTRVG